MMRRCLAVLALVTALGLAMPATVHADGPGKGKGKGKSHAAKKAGKHDHDKWKDWDHKGWERRGKYEVRILGANDGFPPGWSEGRKAGWRDCGMPPGLAKKRGCRSVVYRGRRCYYYRDDVGRIIIRRPIIHAEINIGG